MLLVGKISFCENNLSSSDGTSFSKTLWINVGDFGIRIFEICFIAIAAISILPFHIHGKGRDLVLGTVQQAMVGPY